MLSEEKEKKQKNWSILFSSQETTLLLYPVVSSCGDPVPAYSNIFQYKSMTYQAMFHNAIKKKKKNCTACCTP